MKKSCLVLLVGTLLSMMLCVPAMATTAITVDGKTYVFSGEQSVFEAAGKTFIIGEDSVRIQEAGKPDRVLPLAVSADSAGTIVEGTSTSASTAASAAMISDASTSTANEAAAIAVEDAADTIVTISTVAEGRSVRQGEGDAYSQYARFGLSYDASGNVLSYQGQRVRFFEDSYSLNNIGIAIRHFDKQGTIDVEAQRYLSADNTGGSDNSGDLLTGLRVLSPEEFAARDLTQWTQSRMPHAAASTSSERLMTAEEKRAFYAPYAEYGLLYDAKTDSLIYQGQVVRRFLDIWKSNGEAPDSGRFSGTITSLNNASGTIDITAVRDYTTPDAEGNGKLIGLRGENVK